MIGEPTPDQSLAVLSKSSACTVRDGRAAVLEVEKRLDRRVPLTPVPELDGAMPVRPVDMLRTLALASSMSLRGHLLEASAYWAVLRYLGAFSSVGPGRLALSEAGDHVAGNQRALLSQELGIAFGLQVAAHWIRWKAGVRNSVVWIADVDLLDDSFKPWSKAPNRRPDYVVMAPSTQAGHFHVGLVECKGTGDDSQGRRQMADGCVQITESVDHKHLPGLVVGGVFTSSPIELRAVAVGDAPGELDRHDSRVEAVLRGSLEGLAVMSGNDAAAARFERGRRPDGDSDLPPLRRRGPRPSRTPREDLGAIGLTVRLGRPNGTTDVFLGVDRDLDDAMTRGEVDAAAALRLGPEYEYDVMTHVGRGKIDSTVRSRGRDGGWLEIGYR